MKQIIIVFLVYFFFSCTGKTHKLDGVWEYSHSTFVLKDSLPKSQNDSIIQYLTDRDDTFALMIKNKQLKENVDSVDGVYYFDKRMHPCTVSTIITDRTPMSEKYNVPDTLYTFVNDVFVYALRYVDENKIERYSHGAFYIEDTLKVEYINFTHYNRLKDDNKFKEIKF